MRLIFLIFLIFLGCSQQVKRSPHVPISPLAVRELQINRTANFQELVGRGVIEFRWTDEDGKHREQGDVDFWKQGEALSLRISKLGELIMWFGGDANQTWLFDLLRDETTLSINGESNLFSDIKMALVLLGLSPLPAGELTVAKDGVVTLLDAEGKKWTLLFDQDMNRPIEITVVDSDETSRAIHRRRIRVELENLNELHWPVTGGLIDLTSTRGNTEIKIAFETLSTVVSAERFDRVMSLSFLEKALKPVRTYTAKDD
jgi:hypothetical protein